MNYFRDNKEFFIDLLLAILFVFVGALAFYFIAL